MDIGITEALFKGSRWTSTLKWVSKEGTLLGIESQILLKKVRERNPLLIYAAVTRLNILERSILNYAKVANLCISEDYYKYDLEFKTLKQQEQELNPISTATNLF